MPIYKLRCPVCGEEQTVMCKISERKGQRCTRTEDGGIGQRPERCAGILEPLVTSCSFALKGGSWYRDGYQEKPPSKTAEKVDVTSDVSTGSGVSPSSRPAPSTPKP